MLSRFAYFGVVLVLSAMSQVATASAEVPFINVLFDVDNIPEPVPPPEEVRDFFELDPFYQQWIGVEGLPVVASAQVNPYALKEAAWQIWQMIGYRREVLQVLAEKQLRFSVIGYTEILADIPEYSDHIDFLTYRQRGVAGGGVSGYIAVTTSEENLLHYPGGGGSFNVLIHEIGHAIHLFGLNTLDPTFDTRLNIAYEAAMANGLWQGTYASVDRREYWAEGTRAWFYPKGTGSFNNYGTTRQALKAYDIRLAALLAEIYGDGDWRYTPPTVRMHLPHLQGFNPEHSPTFRHRPELEELYRQFRDPNSDGGDNWVDLRPYDPSLIPILNESKAVDNRTMIAFVNLTQADISIYSVGRNGTERFWTRARPGRVRWTRTRINAVLLIKDPNDKNLVAFQAEGQTGRAIVSAEMALIGLGLSKASGDNQTGVSGAALPKPFVVEVRDENLSPLEGISIMFAVTAGDGVLRVTHTTTDANGRAESAFTLGPHLGTNTVEASAVGTEQTVIFNAVAEAAVEIPDPNLRAAIERALGKAADDPITPSELATLTRLEAPEAGISNLTGLEHATNLTYLDFWKSSVSDLSPVAGLTNLTHLGVAANNAISDVSALVGLTNLTALWVNSNLISDISPLAGLTQLSRLGLDNNNISNISALVGLTNLTLLKLNNNPLSYQSIHTHIPALQSRGVTVEFDNQAHPALLKISGDNQNGASFASLSQPFIVEAQDANGAALARISVTFAVTTGGGTLSTTITRTDRNGRAQSTLTLGPNLGTNTVEVSATGIKASVTFHAIADTELSPTIADVNNDGSVNVLDLLVIASELGNQGQNLTADVNSDGVVNILDLILVAGMFDGAAAAPSAQPQVPETLTAVEVQGWLTNARGLEIRDPIMKRGFLVLEQLLVSLTPKETKLLANYPNPFNPETWIPYRLAEEAFVTLTIYDEVGRVVRTLEVGHRIAAAYESQSKAIYWNGRNGLGEQIASGVYFYTLTAGDFSATRKMLILK